MFPDVEREVQHKDSKIPVNNSAAAAAAVAAAAAAAAILVGCDLRPVSSMCCLRKQMCGIVLFLKSWERDSGPKSSQLLTLCPPERGW